MADKKYESLKIENIVASGAIAETIDLVELSAKVPNCELNKKRFPGAVYRITDPKIATLIFSSGKVVLTGMRNRDALTKGLAVITKSLNDAGIETLKEPKVGITNMVCSYDLGKYINLNSGTVAAALQVLFQLNDKPQGPVGDKDAVIVVCRIAHRQHAFRQIRESGRQQEVLEEHPFHIRIPA